MPQTIDLTGQRFGRLVVVSFSHKTLGAYWNCCCDCGEHRVVSSNNLRRGNSKSCGCVRREKLVARTTRHGMSQTRLHRIWAAMLQRCHYEKNNNYERYGGRGIAVCSAWRSSFEAFRDWALANGYRDDLTIDRMNNDGNYEPGNCRWATRLEQERNKRAKFAAT